MSTFKREWYDEICRVVAALGGLQAATEEFFFLRHGQTDHNLRRVVQPPVGVSLDDTGRQQAEAAALKLVGKKVRKIIASDSERAWETAQTVSRVCGWPVHEAPALRERHWGILIGGSNVGLDWGASPADGETLAQFTTRTLQGLKEALHSDEVLITAHGGTYFVLLAALGIPHLPELPMNATPMRLVRDASHCWQLHQL